MVGQGRPHKSRPTRASPSSCQPKSYTWLVLIWVLNAALASSLSAASAGAAESTLRLRIAWGGGAECQWKGTVAVSEGALAEPQALGVEADEPGSIWLADGQLHVRERSPRAYNGVDLLVRADLEAKLSITLAPLSASEAPAPIEIRLADLVGDSYSSQLDSQGNRLLVVRSPGDRLRVHFERGSLVFSPGETFSLEIQPHLLGLATGSPLRISGQLTAASSGARLWSSDFEAVSNEPGSPGKPYALTLKLPDAEGVYDLTFTAASAKQRQRLPWKKPIVERKVQLVVIDSKPPAAETVTLARITEIDPVNPRWRERLGNIPLWPGERKVPLSSGEATRWEHPQLGPFMQLGSATHGAKTSWEAYPLPLNQPGQPHVLEVEYPGNVPQALGLSILEPNAAGAVMPVGLDSGVYVADEEADSAPQLLKHRLVFWPRTKSPLLLITNQRDATPALYGKIRVLGAAAGLGGLGLGRGNSAPLQLPHVFAQEPTGDRLLAGYYDRPLVAENFSANEALDVFSRRSLDDWTTFYQAGTRLVDYLGYVGYNGLMLSVAADGSGLYPSQQLQPTPRHDTGIFFANGQDPLRKDVLELLFRLFDRQKMRLIPVVHFTGPLPELESLRRQDPTDDGLSWIGPDGAPWSERPRERAEQVAPYNPLDPRVQQAMLNVVKELSERYGEHASFGGIALRLSADGYAQLPTADGGYDDDTLRRLERDTHLQVPGEGANRFAARARFLNSAGKSTWYTWRANQIAALHLRMQQEIAAVRPEAHLYLAAATLLEHRHLQRSLRPGLPRRVKVDDVLLGLGVRPDAYRNDERIILLRPQEVRPAGALAAQAVELEVNTAPEVDRLFSVHRHSGSLFYHEPQRVRVASFDAKSPFGAANTFTSLVSEFSPSAERNRRRFVHSLATLDAQQMFDGGWLLPLGQEAALAELVSVYRQLPAARFDTLAEESQPVTIRTLERGGQTYVYLTNDSPWPISVALDVDAPATLRVEKLGAASGVGPITRNSDATTWTINLRPYDLAAARLSGGDVRLRNPKLTLPPKVSASLERRIRDLSARIAALGTVAPLEALENSGFEAPLEDGNVPGWALATPGAGHVELQEQRPHGGGNSLLLKHTGTAGGTPAVLRSNAFPAPATGRLSVALWLRTADRSRQPPVRVAIEAHAAEGEYHRYASLGAGAAGAQLTEQWAQYIFQVDDLPTENVAEVRLRVDLAGAGEIWLDDIEIHDLAFAESERVELTKIVTLASYKLQAGQLADCARILDGYWPQFLVANVPLVHKPLPVAQRPNSEPTPQREPAKKAGRLEQIKGYLPKWPQF